jgi:hypothetical protein
MLCFGLVFPNSHSWLASTNGMFNLKKSVVGSEWQKKTQIFFGGK